MSGTELPSGMEQTLEELDELVDGLASYQPNADAEADGVVPAVKSVSRAAMSPKPTLPRDKAVSVNKENRAMSSKMERERPDFTEEDEEPTLAERVWASLGQCWAKLRVAGASVFTLPKKGLPFLKTVGTSIVALVRATGQILFSCLNLFLAKREKDEPETVRESASSSVTAQNTQTPQIDSADIDYDLEDEGRFRWVALGIKATALAAMVLILVGGYVAAKTFLAPRKPDSRAEVTEVARLADEKAAAEKLAAEKLAAEKLAAEKLAAEKLAAEKLAAEKLAAEKLAAEKLAAEKLAAEKLAAEKLAAEKLAAEKLAAEDVADPFGVALDSIAETTPVSDKATELAIDDGFPMQATQEQIVPVTPAEPQAPVLPLEAPASPIAAASQTNHAGIPSKDSLTQITESGFPVVTPLGPEPAALPLLTQSEVTPSIPVSNDIEKLTGPPGTDAIDQQSEVAPRIEVPVMAMDTTMPTPVAPPEVVLSEAGLSAVTVPTETPAVATLSNRQAMELPDFARTTQEISHRAATEVVTNPSPQTAQLSEQTFAQNLQQEVASLRQTPPPSTPHRLRLQSSQPTNDEPIPALNGAAF